MKHAIRIFNIMTKDKKLERYLAKNRTGRKALMKIMLFEPWKLSVTFCKKCF